MSKNRNVKTVGSALSRTNVPVKAGDGLENVIAGLGTDRDKRSYSNYCMPRVLTRFELENMYRCSWLSKRIVNVVADDMTQKWRDISLDDSDDNPKLESLENEEKRLNVIAKFNEAIRWSRLYGGSIMILGTRDVINMKDLSKPLDVTKVRQGDLRYIHVVDRWRCAPSGMITTDITSPNFGLPDSYILAESSINVHWTRVIRFDGEVLPYFSWTANGWWHDSVLQHVYDSIQNYDTTSGALASMLFEANVDVIQVEGLTNLLATKEGEAKLTKRFQMAQLMKSFNRTLILDAKEQYEKKTNTFAGLADLWEKYAVDSCGSSNIPMTRLFGQSPGGLNSTGDGDLENYYGRIGADQNTILKPKLDYFDEVFVRSVLGDKPDDYSYEFASLWEIDDAARSAMQYQDAQRDQIYLTTGVISEGLVASQLKLKGVYQTMSDEDVQLAEELSTSMDDHQEGMRDNQLAASDPEQQAKLAKASAKAAPPKPTKKK